MDDIKNIAIEVDDNQEAEVIGWFQEKKIPLGDVYDRPDGKTFLIAVDPAHDNINSFCKTSLSIRNKTVLSYTDWKSRFAGSDEKEEWFKISDWCGELVTPNKWYKIIEWDGGIFYFINNAHDKHGLHKTDFETMLQFSSTPSSEDKKVIVGYKLIKEFPSSELLCEVGDVVYFNSTKPDRLNENLSKTSQFISAGNSQKITEAKCN